MSVVVLSCGRTGTNVALEILRGCKSLNATKIPEDKELFKRDTIYPNNYLTKMDTCYIEYKDLRKLLSTNADMDVIWTIRDPRDMFMSKIRRGQPVSEGGDCQRVADDATIEGCVKDVEHMIDIYHKTIEEFPEYIKLIKMEDMILETKKTAKEMCDFLQIDFHDDMVNFPSRMRNSFKLKRYKGIDKSQVGLWRDWENVYDGWFVKRGYDMESLFKEIKPIIEYFNYE